VDADLWIEKGIGFERRGFWSREVPDSGGGFAEES
jgi:hypothetical protein